MSLPGISGVGWLGSRNGKIVIPIVISVATTSGGRVVLRDSAVQHMTTSVANTMSIVMSERAVRGKWQPPTTEELYTLCAHITFREVGFMLPPSAAAGVVDQW